MIITEVVIPGTGDHGTLSIMMYLIVYKMSYYLYMFMYTYINIHIYLASNIYLLV